MYRRGPSWQNYEDTQTRANNAEQDLAIARQQVEDLKTLNKQMLTEAQMEDGDTSVPVADAQYIHGLGKYMRPVESTLENHFRLIYDRSNELDFWADQSPAFDGLVAQTFLDPAFSMSNHPRYFDYEPLRDNVSTVRNFVLQNTMQGLDQRDSAQMRNAERKLEQMGREVGVALQRDSLFSRLGSSSLDVTEASEPGAGAAKIYDLLVKKQKNSGFMAPLKAIFGYNYSDWGLPQTESSPFNKANVDAFCMDNFANDKSSEHMSQLDAAKSIKAAREARRQADALTPPAPAEPVQPESTAEPATAQEMGLSNAQKLSVFGAGIAGSAFSLDRVKRLTTPVKDRSVELARDILDKMRVTVQDTSRDQWLEAPTENALAQNEAINSVARIYADSFQEALSLDPSIKENAVVLQGHEAMGKLAYLTKQQAGMKLVDEGRMDDALMVMAELESYPESWKESQGESIESLLAQMQGGLEMTHHAVQKAQQKGLTTQQPIAQVAQAQEEKADLATLIAQARQQTESPAPQQQAATTKQPSISAEQLQQLLSQGDVSAKDLASMRQMQNQASTMSAEAPAPQTHAETVGRAAPAAAAQQQPAQGNYRSAVQQPQPEMSIKR